MVHAHKRNLPCNSETFGRIEAGREARSHARSTRNGDEVGLALREPCCPGLNRDGVQGVVVGAGLGCIRERLEGCGNKGRKILFMRSQCYQRVDAAVLAIVRRNFLVEVEGCRGARRSWAFLFKWVIMLGEDCDRGIITGALSIQNRLRKPIADMSERFGEGGGHMVARPYHDVSIAKVKRFLRCGDRQSTR